MNNLELTELPELPNDAFWRISETRRQSGFAMLWDRQGAFVAVMVPTRIDKTVPKEIKLPFGITFEYGTKIESNVHNEEVVRVFITKTEMVKENVYDDDDKVTGTKEVEETNTVNGDDLTPDIILAAAQIAYERYLDVIKSRHFLGDYPPKSLAKVIEENA